MNPHGVYILGALGLNDIMDRGVIDTKYYLNKIVLSITMENQRMPWEYTTGGPNLGWWSGEASSFNPSHNPYSDNSVPERLGWIFQHTCGILRLWLYLQPQWLPTETKADVFPAFAWLSLGLNFSAATLVEHPVAGLWSWEVEKSDKDRKVIKIEGILSFICTKIYVWFCHSVTWSPSLWKRDYSTDEEAEHGRVRNLLKVTQLTNASARIWTQSIWL